jgi:hypothetical protein
VTKEQEIILKIYDELYISEQGYHRRGAAHRVFCILMDNMETVTKAQGAKWVAERMPVREAKLAETDSNQAGGDAK